MLIGVIIISYNTAGLLRDCLTSLRACDLPLQTVVVDNGSQDSTPAMVQQEFPEVALLEPGRNLGFAAANNLGMAWFFERPAAPDYLLLLNPDTVVHPNAIATLVAFLEQHPHVGMVSPRLLNPDGSLQAAAFRFPTLSMTLLDLFPPGEVLPGRLYHSWWHGRYPQESGDSPFPIDHPLGACMLTRPVVVQQVGGFDEAFFMYAEEVDWCYRIRQAGWAIWQVPTAQVTHVGGASTSQFRSRMQIALYRSRLIYFGKHLTPRQIWFHRLIIYVGMWRWQWNAWQAYRRGQLTHDQLREQWLISTTIAQLPPQ